MTWLTRSLPEAAALGSEHVFFYRDAQGFAEIASFILSDMGMQAKLSVKAREFAQKYDLNVLATILEQILKYFLDRIR